MSKSPAAERLAVFPGSFDPFTVGHQQVVEQALDLFDKVIIAIGQSSSKNSLLSTDERLAAIRETFADEPKIEVAAFSGLVIEFARRRGAGFLVRGLRSEADLAYEMPMAHTNSCLAPGIRTVFFPTAPEKAFISSTLVREIAKSGGDFSSFVPEPFVQRLKRSFS